jgi:hypothetical protein
VPRLAPLLAARGKEKRRFGSYSPYWPFQCSSTLVDALIIRGHLDFLCLQYDVSAVFAGAFIKLGVVVSFDGFELVHVGSENHLC